MKNDFLNFLYSWDSLLFRLLIFHLEEFDLQHVLPQGRNVTKVQHGIIFVKIPTKRRTRLMLKHDFSVRIQEKAQVHETNFMKLG